jgi:3-hydroxyacyl-[acyl-carrier-protein] dehydratase
MRTATERGLGTPIPKDVKLFTPEDDAKLRDALRRCSPSTREAACAYRRTGNPEYVPTIVHGLIEHYVERDLRKKLSGADDNLRLVEDLAIDSLTMMEIVFLTEDVLQISVDNEELRPFRTVGEIKKFIASKLRRPASSPELVFLSEHPK